MPILVKCLEKELSEQIFRFRNVLLNGLKASKCFERHTLTPKLWLEASD